MMNIAVPVENGEIVPKFADARIFRIFETELDEILSSRETAVPEDGYESTLAALLEQKVNLIICQSIGVRGVIAVRNTGIALMGGASGRAEDRVNDFLTGTLHFDRFGSPIATAPKLDAHGNPVGEDADSDGNISACGNPCR